MLAIDNLCVSIGGSRILREVSLELPDSKVFCLMGRNGVGKTTTLKTVVGLYKATSGSIRLDGKDISRLPPEARARAGIGYVPQGRGIFPHLTVEENLFVGAVAQGRKPKRTLDRVFALFPILKDFLPRKGGMLSGGQQQQLAIGRALLTEPKVLILDEPTEGIQPNIIDQIGEAIKLLRRGGHHNEAMLLAEAAQSLRKLREEGQHPKPELLEGLADQIRELQREGAHRDVSVFQHINDSFATLRKEGPHEGTLLKDEIANALTLLIGESSMTILLVEQYLDFCKELADNFAILDRGSVVARGAVAELTDEVVKEHLTV
ncbi:MAG TPA: ATP-binding cassette domain-containing protein [Terrimicrobiaceae bacterium]|nr:ATP-binding cassette domain-containing protein [Terrimicrobiaceae bacterium]